MKKNLICLLILSLSFVAVHSCSSSKKIGERNYTFEGEWTWSDGTDSLWVQLRKGEPFSFNDHEGKDTAFNTISGIYNLYRKGKLITGNHDSRTIYGVLNNSKIQKVVIYDRPGSDYYYSAHLLLSSPTKNKLKWVFDIYPIEKVWVNKRPKPIVGFQLPNDIVLTRLKE